jgi:hypothetical protein
MTGSATIQHHSLRISQLQQPFDARPSNCHRPILRWFLPNSLFNQEPVERPPNLLRKRDPVTCFEPQHVKQELPRASYAHEDVEWMFQKVAAEQAWQP